MRDKISSCALQVKQHLISLFDLDLSAAVACSAISHSLSIAKISSTSLPALELNGVFHPSIEMAHNGSAVPNNMTLGSGSRVAVVTGANMSGKSTLLRAVALVSWYTQCGLPSACSGASVVSLFDSIFVRVGSSDDIANDQSSFMMEMLGVSALLREDGPMLCALDELGRSTCPEDGASLCAALIRRLGSKVNKEKKGKQSTFMFS